ncbi:MAG TPA: ParB N-terminal domain-containing protein [Candidatus Binatia bacterium]
MSKKAEMIELAGAASVDSRDGRGNTTTSIKITCKAATNIELAELQPLQGNLKELSYRNFEKLKRSIVRHGISFPFFVWQKDGINYVLDGHQRDRTLLKMQEQGYRIPPLPCALIEARDRREAAEKILLVSSQYGKMSEQSLDEFLSENELDMNDLLDELELPALDMRYFGTGEFEPTDENDQGRLDKKNPVTCPECGHEFVP